MTHRSHFGTFLRMFLGWLVDRLVGAGRRKEMGILRSSIRVKDGFVCLSGLSGSEHFACPHTGGLGEELASPD